MNTIRYFAALAATALVALVPQTASAQQTLNGATTLYACYVPKSGTVYRIKVEGAPGKCAQNHVEFSWTTGDQQPQQMLDLVVTDFASYTLNAGAGGGFDAVCPTGYLVVAGGFIGAPNVVLNESHANLDKTSWRFIFLNNGSGPVDVYVRASCIKLQ